MHTLIDVKFPSSFACFLASHSGYEEIFCVADIIIRRQYGHFFYVKCVKCSAILSSLHGFIFSVAVLFFWQPLYSRTSIKLPPLPG